MTVVRIVKNWDWPDLMRQTPGHCGIWDGITFTEEPVEECDYTIVLNGAKESTSVTCAPQQIWYMAMEPPTEFRKFWHDHPSYAFRTFTTDPNRQGQEYIHSHGTNAWQFDADYDFLLSCDMPEKTRQLAWITSNQSILKGHRKRMIFLKQIRGKLDFDLWGRGFRPIADKWAGLAPYRYSIAVENYRNSLYWSEKLIDCYLAWCMPIYYGCTRITDYFPAESLIQVDINEPKVAVEIIKEAIADQAWARNLDAITHARELILNQYQMFPFLVRQIRHFESTHGRFFEQQTVTIPRRAFNIEKRFWPELAVRQATYYLTRWIR